MRPKIEHRSDGHEGDRKLQVWIPEFLWQRLHLLLALRGERKGLYVIRQMTAAVETDLKEFPVHRCWLRPGATIYYRDGDRLIPGQKSAGGERAWPIEVVPMTKEGALGWKVDLTSDGGGLEARGVYIRLEDLIGEKPPATTHT